uniref:Uncharacterized protein n=1 Tax=Anguilla anguilla TaxID=7936 RepID=A0A0E9QDZ9_ANGAN
MKLPSLMPSNHTSRTARHFPVFTVFKASLFLRSQTLPCNAPNSKITL